MNPSTLRRQIVLLVWCAVLLIPIAMGGIYVYTKHQLSSEQLAKLEPRISRLAGLQADKPELEKLAKSVTERLQKQTYPASQDATQSGNDAQQKLRALFTASGLDVVSSQVLAPKQEKDFDRIPLVFRLEGQLNGLQAAMLVLSNETPSILVESFNVQTIGYVKADTPQRLAIQFNLSVLRLRS